MGVRVMAKAVKHTVTFPDGTTQVRRSPRIYTHAIAARGNVARARKEAYEHVPSEEDFQYYQAVATGNSTLRQSQEDVVKAQAEVEGGWEGFVARHRQWRIDRFEEALAAGKFGWRVERWSQSAAAAKKAFQEFSGYPQLQEVCLLFVRRSE
jgi:hypothetical protein